MFQDSDQTGTGVDAPLHAGGEQNNGPVVLTGVMAAGFVQRTEIVEQGRIIIRHGFFFEK